MEPSRINYKSHHGLLISSVLTLVGRSPASIITPDESLKGESEEASTADGIWYQQLRASLFAKEATQQLRLISVPLNDIQLSITKKDRHNLVDCLIRQSYFGGKRLRCERVTLGLAVHWLDQMLLLRPFPRGDLHLLGITCYYLAGKVCHCRI